MARLEEAFDATGEEKLGNYEPLPYGWYNLNITKSELKDNSTKTGKFISLEFTVLDGEYKGRKVWSNLNIKNPNQVTVEIARKTLASICEACNKLQIQDTQELHGIPFQALLKIKQGSGDYPPSNSPISFKQYGEKVSNPNQGKKTDPSKTVQKPKKAETKKREIEVKVDEDSPAWDD